MLAATVAWLIGVAAGVAESEDAGDMVEAVTEAVDETAEDEIAELEDDTGAEEETGVLEVEAFELEELKVAEEDPLREKEIVGGTLDGAVYQDSAKCLSRPSSVTQTNPGKKSRCQRLRVG